MMNKRLKQGSTFLLAVALTFPLLTLPGAKAASAINHRTEVFYRIQTLVGTAVNF